MTSKTKRRLIQIFALIAIVGLIGGSLLSGLINFF